MGFIADVRFPVTDGLLVSHTRTHLIATGFGTGLTVQRKLPDTKTRRMVTFRNDSGPQDLTRSLRRYGINGWSDDSLDAEKMLIEVMAGLRLLPGVGAIKFTDSFTGPFEIDDDPPITVGNQNLTHFYCALRVGVKGSKR